MNKNFDLIILSLFLTFSFVSHAFDDDFFYDRRNDIPTPYTHEIGQYSIWTQSKSNDQNPFSMHNGCLFQFIDSPSLKKIKFIKLTRQSEGELILSFHTENNFNITFTKLKRSCLNSSCELQPDPKKNLFTLRSVDLNNGLKKQFKIELIRLQNEEWLLKTNHEVQLVGLIPINSHAELCWLREYKK